MTKANASSEPSMEEILASIRKIIAEDPPGSRPTPPAKPVVSEDRSFGARDAFWRSPATPTQRVEPAPPARALAPAPAAAASAPKAEMPIFPAAREPNPLLTRDEARAAKDLGPPAKADTRDIDEQLSDLLSDDLKSIDDEGADAAISVDETEREERSLTVSRVAFEPQDRGASVDPFDFKLGPSPFSARDERSSQVQTLVEAQPVQPSFVDDSPDRNAEQRQTADRVSVSIAPIQAQETKNSRAAVTDSVVAAAQEALWSSVPVAEKVAAETVSAYVTAERSVQSGVKTADSAAPADAVRQQPQRPEQPFVVRDLHNTPSVAATIGPIRKLGPYPDILTPSPAAAPTPDQKVRPDEERQAKASEAETVLFQRADGALTPAPISMSMTDLDHRTMEDTVADLLRPMLKQWLSENMPKIVERALRRELLERGPNHKSAAE